jgi:lysozyme family protein
MNVFDQAKEIIPWLVNLIEFGVMAYIVLSVVRVLDHALARAQAPDGSSTLTEVPAPKPPPILPTPSKPVPAAPLPPVLKPVGAPSKPASEYDRMWAAMQITPAHQGVIERDAGKILPLKARYEGVSEQCGVPWYVIGLIDIMEAGGGCDAHLHNGDPLKGRTIHVPAGRPPAPAEPPFTWEQSALDALKFEGFDKIKDWSLSGVAGALEHYNGMGYHLKGMPSPYLWSFSNQYKSGKFVADHVFDPNAVSEQAGAMPILKALMALDPSITF